MTILDKIIADKTIEVAERKKLISLVDLLSTPLFSRTCFSLSNRLKGSATGIIAEFKRKSPSKGWMHEDADAAIITKAYETAGAVGISVLTDTPYFGGTMEDLTMARINVDCPLLRKDFIVDAYQLYEAKAKGADVILLIAAALTVEQTYELAKKARELGLEVLLEVHNKEELTHTNEFVNMVGVNNRNLKTFEVDTNLSIELVGLIPDSYVKISESGLASVEIVRDLKAAGYQGFLMGEHFMRTDKPGIALKQFIEQLL